MGYGIKALASCIGAAAVQEEWTGFFRRYMKKSNYISRGNVITEEAEIRDVLCKRMSRCTRCRQTLLRSYVTDVITGFDGCRGYYVLLV